ncbi:PD-(D/E)XK nuclease superfamily protein [Butyrivibrio fibrisolvens]|uniref:PD-(D/E)XK nuclease superfamily protein n=1 Tax=Butyrivibrio fibrisolvens TaxID=831 RepID=A0A1H9XB48_BUTFI|nr:AAA-like domain-containing protein [Butyrivibrio fibrisolvens]SES43279.1 PD-(D/E)XK nuclease superfamily protein [Butyrivibrio fibrisolvens]
MRTFNTAAVCVPTKHYMVDLSERIVEIRKLVDDGRYFTVNRARQYGKTTTLTALRSALSKEYDVVFIDFQSIGKSGYSTEEKFVQEFCRLLWNRRELDTVDMDCIIDNLEKWKDSDEPKARLGELFDTLMKWCKNSQRDIVLIIDEVDTATNNQVFLDFLAQLRDKYISRDRDGIRTFQSVILAGVTDVKHLKSKIRDEEDSKENSPWNIAADFTIDMSLSADGIKGMLDEYEEDHHTGMNTEEMAELIRDYTNGYPFLVSRICELLDTEVGKKIENAHDRWTRDGIDEAIKMILSEDNTLFQSLTGKLNNLPELKASLRSILMEGTKLTWNPDQRDIVLMQMYGFVRNYNNSVRIDNRIFETRLYNLFLSEEEMKSSVFFREGDLAKNIFVENGKLNVRLILEHFIQTYHQVYGPLEEKFKEKDGREQFLLYLKPIINGTGNYYIEAQTRDQKRTDIIIDYLGHQYIIELKIWHGERYNESGEKQISEYLDFFGLNTGYMLSFNFNRHKEVGVKQVHVGDKLLYEATV